MTRRTGNHTSAPQWIYFLWNFPYVWIVKIGIGGKLRTRTRQVGKSAPGLDIPVFALWVVGAYQVEQFIHWSCSWCRVRLGKRWGTGRTERFYLPALPVGIVISLAWAVFSWGSVGLLLYVIIKQI